MVLGPFAEPKGPRLPGRNPASLVHVNHSPFYLIEQYTGHFPRTIRKFFGMTRVGPNVNGS
jgi:hypothetical protein